MSSPGRLPVSRARESHGRIGMSLGGGVRKSNPQTLCASPPRTQAGGGRLFGPILIQDGYLDAGLGPYFLQDTVIGLVLERGFYLVPLFRSQRKRARPTS